VVQLTDKALFFVLHISLIALFIIIVLFNINTFHITDLLSVIQLVSYRLGISRDFKNITTSISSTSRLTGPHSRLGDLDLCPFNLKLVRNIDRGMDNLPTNFGASGTFRSRLMGQHLL